METAQEIADTKRGEAREARETVDEAVGKARDTASRAAREAQYKAKSTVENAKDRTKTLGNDIAGNVSEAAKNVASYLGSKETVDYATGVGNLMGFATAYGLCVWVTFISSYVLSRAMPRHQFALVQSKIYPVYFRVMGYSIGLALLGHLLRHRNTVVFFSGKPEMLQIYNLLASLFTIFVNSVYLEPRATKVSSPIVNLIFYLVDGSEFQFRVAEGLNCCCLLYTNLELVVAFYASNHCAENFFMWFGPKE